MEVKYRVNEGDRVTFNNAVDFCVGTGRMGLALQEEYMQQELNAILYSPLRI